MRLRHQRLSECRVASKNDNHRMFAWNCNCWGNTGWSYLTGTPANAANFEIWSFLGFSLSQLDYIKREVKMMMKPRLWRSTGNAEKYIVSLVFVFNLNGRLARNEDIVSTSAKPHNLSNARHIHRKRIKTNLIFIVVSVSLELCLNVRESLKTNFR